MTDNTSRLKRRVEYLLAAGKKSLRHIGVVTKITATVFVLLLILILPKIELSYAQDSSGLDNASEPDSIDPLDPTELSDVSTTTTVQISRQFSLNNFFPGVFGKPSIVWDTGSVNWEGDFDTNDNEDDIIELSDGGYIEYRSDENQTKHRIRYESKSGIISKTHWRNGDITERDDEGRKWLETGLVQVLRATGINAEKRVARMLKQGGPDDVIKELDNENWQALFIAAESIGSDNEAHKLISSLIDVNSGSESVSELALDATNTIGSDLEMAETIVYIVERGAMSDVAWQLAIEKVSNNIGSSHERVNALRTIAENLPDNKILIKQYYQVVINISSKSARNNLILL